MTQTAAAKTAENVAPQALIQIGSNRSYFLVKITSEDQSLRKRFRNLARANDFTDHYSAGDTIGYCANVTKKRSLEKGISIVYKFCKGFATPISLVTQQMQDVDND